MANRNRDRLEVQPLGTSRRLALVEKLCRVPPGAERLFELDNGAHGGDEYGWLLRMGTGLYAILDVTGAIRSDADTLDAVIAEMRSAASSERQGRVIDRDEAASMERKKREGYF